MTHHMKAQLGAMAAVALIVGLVLLGIHVMIDVGNSSGGALALAAGAVGLLWLHTRD